MSQRFQLFPFLGLFFLFQPATLRGQEIIQTTLPVGATSFAIAVDPIEDEGGLRYVTLFAMDVEHPISGRYQIQQGTTFSEWIPLVPFHEGPLPDRQVFVLGDLPLATTSVAFSFDLPLPVAAIVRQFCLHKDVAENALTTPESTCNCSQPSYCDRDCWCPSGNCDPVSPAVTIAPSHLIVHHSAGNNNSTNWAGIVQAIWDFHVNTNGWDDVGYNWLIDPNGVIYEGRGSAKRGAHFSCMNGASTGICLIGNYSSVSPTSPAINALTAFLTWEACDKDIAPGGISMHQPSQQYLPNISGHRDGNSSPAPGSCASGTVCPGDSLYDQLMELSLSVAAKPCFWGGAQEKVVLSAAASNATTYLGGETLNFFGQQTYLGAADSLRYFSTAVFWSETPTFSPGATRLATDSMLLDSTQRSHTFHGSFAIPAATPQGQYYLHFFADYDSVLAPHAQRQETQVISVSGTVHAPEPSKNAFKIYPNPTTDYFSISTNQKIRSIALYSNAGQLIRTLPHDHKRHSLIGLAEGQYIVEIITEEGEAVRERIYRSSF